MIAPNENVAKKLLHELYLIEHNEKVEEQIANIKTELEESGISGNMIFESRIKGPISALRKYSTSSEKELYQAKWNGMKDLLGLMLVVDTNDEVDKFLNYIKEHYSKYKNPNSESLIVDYRRVSSRKPETSSLKYIYEDPTHKDYQVNDGYKSSKANLMIDDVPIEIQIKTKAQYIAHLATHDSIYKNAQITDKKTRYAVADKLFPYFEAFAYLRLNRDDLSQKKIEKVENDIKNIFERNFDYYNKFPKVFNEARCLFGVNFYLLQNRDKFLQDALFSRVNFNLQLASAQVKQVYEYIYDRLSRERPSLKQTQLVSQTVDALVKLPYDSYKKIRTQIAGEYRHGACLVTGIFDVLQPMHINLFEELSKVYKEVNVGVISDEISKAYFGQNTVFNEEQRKQQVEKCKGVTSSNIISSYTLELTPDIGPLQLDEPKKKKFDLAYVSGVFDGFHPGHIEHLQTVINESEDVYVGIKSDEYSKRIKHKTTINNEKDRLKIVQGMRGITKVFITETDMFPPKEFLEKAKEITKNGGQVAVYLGSDWQTKLNEKPKSSLDELKVMLSDYPNIVLTSTNRTNEKVLSSTTLRKKLEEAKKRDTLPLELTDLGDKYV